MNFKAILIALVIWLLSMFLLHFYVKGDQVVYSQLYDALASTKFAEVSATAYFYVTSVEPVSNYILWIGAIAGVPKNIYISSLNVLLIMAILLLGASILLFTSAGDSPVSQQIAGLLGAVTPTPTAVPPTSAFRTTG